MNKQALSTAILMLTVGLGIGYWLARQQFSDNQPQKITETSRKPLYYRNPMNPSVTSPIPTKDPMGMDYVPVYAEEKSTMTETSGTVKIDPVTVQNIGVRTARAKRTTLSHVIRAVGRVAFNEELLTHLHPKIEGWVENMNVDKTGEWVEKNADLLSIYSPQLVTSQQEYILALNNLKALKDSPIEDVRTGAENLVKSSRQRLKMLDVPQHQIDDLTKTHRIKKSLHIHTPAKGVVIQIGAREGQHVTPSTKLYMIADLTRIWVFADIYENELPWVQVGDAVEIQLAGVPGRTFKGHLSYIYPYAEAKTRTIKVRAEFDNSELLLKPEMFAEVTILARRQVDAIVIPSEAVIRSGAHTQVFVVRGPGKFEPRRVKLGLSSNGQVAILEGLHEGDSVVTSSQFLIDSESKLREATAKMLNRLEQKTDKKDTLPPPATEIKTKRVHQHD